MNSVPERRFTDENHAIQAGFLDGPYEALGVRIEIWRMGGEAQCLDARRRERFAKGLLRFEHTSFQANDDPALKLVIYGPT